MQANVNVVDQYWNLGQFFFLTFEKTLFLTHFLMLITNLTVEIENESEKVLFFTFFEKIEIDQDFSIGGPH